jgi:precorrin-8X/cobalt-precorrin-8 methylmutase
VALFDFLIMVDWSGGNSRQSNRSNCIWIAYGTAQDPQPICVSPPSRSEATAFLIDLLRPFSMTDDEERPEPLRRAIVCFDFPYGYPHAFAQALPAIPGAPAVPWQRVWHYLQEHIQDDIGTLADRRPTNISNRFTVANALNGLLSHPPNLGPFWCTDSPTQYPSVPQNEPIQPFPCATGATIQRYRLIDQQVQSDFPFRLFGNGSVGSQMLVGIPRLMQLRYHAELERVSSVWPFETGWAPANGEWSLGKTRVLHAEIYPSVMPALTDAIKDRGQVRAMWEWARTLDAQGTLCVRFACPPSVSPNQDLCVRGYEGWILH